MHEPAPLQAQEGDAEIGPVANKLPGELGRAELLVREEHEEQPNLFQSQPEGFERAAQFPADPVRRVHQLEVRRERPQGLLPLPWPLSHRTKATERRLVAGFLVPVNMLMAEWTTPRLQQGKLQF